MAEDPVAEPVLADDGKNEEEQGAADASWGESSWKEQGDAGWGASSWKADAEKGDAGWGESSWKADAANRDDAKADETAVETAVAPAEEPKETAVEINARSSNTDLEDGGIRVDDLASFQCRMLSGPVSSASGAWLETADAPTTSKFRTGKIFTLSESSGAVEQRKRAQKYARLAGSAKNGWATIDTTEDNDTDLSVMTVPEDSRNKVIGNNGLLLVKLSEDKKVVVVAIDDGNSVPQIIEVKPPEPWLAVGQQVQVLHKGDVRFKKWMTGTVKKIVSQSMVAVGLERGGTDVVVDWYASARPNFKESEEMEAYVEVPAAEPAGEDGEAAEASNSTSTWAPATFVSWAESGSANVKKSDGTEAELDSKSVRPPLLVQEETAAEEAPRPNIRLAIFGEERGRVEAVLSIMSSVEWNSPGFFDSNPAPLPPVLDLTLNGDANAEEWVSASVDISANADKAKKLLPQIQKACDWKAIIEGSGPSVHIIGPRAVCILARGLVSLAAVADRSEVGADQFPEGVESFVERVPMPGDLVPFIAGKQRNRLNELEAEESVIVFFMRHPVPEKVDAEVTEEVKEEGEKKCEPAEASKEETEGAEGDASEDKAKVEGEAEAPAAEEKWGKDWGNDWKTQEWPAEEEKPKVDILIFSMDVRARMRARLPLMRAVEAKAPSMPDPEECICLEDVVATDILDFATEDMGWLSGKQGCNKKRIVAASGCKMEFLTHFAYVAGTLAERARARQYMQWLLLQRPNGGAGLGQREIALTASELEARDDVTVMMLSPDEKSSITQGLGDVEDETNCVMVFQRKPDAEFFAVGEKMSINRGGRSFFIEINEAPAGEEMNFTCKLLPEDPWIDEEEASKVPLLIFSFDSYARATGEKKVRDVLTPEEEAPAWEEKKDSWDAAPAADKWGKQETSWDAKAGGDKWATSGNDKAGGDKWATNGKEEKSWEKPANDWGKKDECGDFKKGRCTRGDQCKFSHDIPGYEDTQQEWNGGRKEAPAWGQDAAAVAEPENAWANWGKAAAPPGFDRKSEAPAWGKAAASDDKWGKKASWDEPAAPAADNKWGNNGSDKWAESKDVKSWENKPADAWGQKEECGDFKKGRCTRGDKCRFSHDIAGYEDTPQEWNGNGTAAPAAASPWDNWKR